MPNDAEALNAALQALNYAMNMKSRMEAAQMEKSLKEAQLMKAIKDSQNQMTPLEQVTMMEKLANIKDKEIQRGLDERKQLLDEKESEAALLSSVNRDWSAQQTQDYVTQLLPSHKVVKEGWGWGRVNEAVVKKTPDDLAYDYTQTNPNDPKSAIIKQHLDSIQYKPYLLK